MNIFANNAEKNLNLQKSIKVSFDVFVDISEYVDDLNALVHLTNIHKEMLDTNSEFLDIVKFNKVETIFDEAQSAKIAYSMEALAKDGKDYAGLKQLISMSLVKMNHKLGTRVELGNVDIKNTTTSPFQNRFKEAYN